MTETIESGPGEERATRLKALIALAVALVFGVAGWIGLSTATQRGVDRLAAIDRGRVGCEQLWQRARNHTDTLRVDEIALTDTVDAMSDQAIDQCGDLRDKSASAREPNPREMNGAPMPRGLR